MAYVTLDDLIKNHSLNTDIEYTLEKGEYLTHGLSNEKNKNSPAMTFWTLFFKDMSQGSITIKRIADYRCSITGVDIKTPEWRVDRVTRVVTHFTDLWNSPTNGLDMAVYFNLIPKKENS